MRPSRRRWPTHKQKKHQPPRRPDPEPTPRELTPGQMAAELVRRGLASPLILDPKPIPRRRDEGTAA